MYNEKIKYGCKVRVINYHDLKDINGYVGVVIAYGDYKYLVEFEGRTDLHGGNGAYDEWSKDYINDKLSSNRWWLAPRHLEIIDVNHDSYEDWLDWEEDWEEDVNEEYYYEKIVFRVGDKVVINDNSMLKSHGYCRGNKMVGEIIKREKIFKFLNFYTVRWEDNTEHIYKDEDLIKLNESDPYQNWEEWDEDREENIKEEYNHRKDIFEVGDIVIANSIHFKNEKGIIKKTGYNKFVLVDFDKSINEITKGLFGGHFGKGLCKPSHGWWVLTDTLKLYNPDSYSNWIEWDQDVNEEYNHEEDKFQVDDKVIINDDSEFKHQGYDKGIKLVGEIIKINPFYRFPYMVRWGNGREYQYRDEDLVLCNSDPYEDWIEWEDDWDENVNEEYNHEEDKFQVDDKVIINDDSVYKYQGYGKNGVRLVGVIIDVKRDNEYEYGVQWEDYTKNDYRRDDLVLCNSDPYEDWIEWEDDWDEKEIQDMNEKYRLIIQEDESGEPTWLLDINIKNIWEKYNGGELSKDEFFEKYKILLLNKKDDIVNNVNVESYTDLYNILEKYDSEKFEQKLNEIYDWGDEHGIKISI
jgi:hypothetical protein